MEEAFTIIMWAIQARGTAQEEALAKLKARGLWLSPEQKRLAGLA